MLRRSYDPACLIERQPLATLRVYVVVHVETQQRTGLAGTVDGSGLSHKAAIDLPIVIAVEIRHADEIEDCESGLPDVRRPARAPPAHLPVEDGASREPRHDEVDRLRAVESRVQHVHADEYLRKVLLLEALDDGARVRRRAAAEVVLGKEPRDFTSVGIFVPLEKPHFVAVRQEHERHAELCGVVPTLILRRNGIDARPLGFQHRHGPALPVAEHVVGLRAVGQHVLEQDARSVGEVPTRVREQGVDFDAREGFGRAAHAAVQGSTTSMSIYTSSSNTSAAEFMQ